MSEHAPWWPDLVATAPTVGSNPRPGEGDRASHEARARALAGEMDGMTVFTLSRPEQLLLWSARRWRHGRYRWDQVEAEYRRLLPEGWADILLAWEEALEVLHAYPTTRPDIGNGCMTALSGDERALLTVLATLQHPRAASGDLLLARLTTPAIRRDLRPALLAVATGLALGGCSLPLRSKAPNLSPWQPAGCFRLAAG
ncbi:hypothetical protein [Niveispirillum irakense]|uniref:hypothetical protein n=1 Tax=Niveispirillum irakense TaxID=34011 RepID=UPI000414380F|nr:hypothetical protein [Niveispirillum irakense]